MGATWWYNYDLGDVWGTEGYMTMESVKDTTVNGISCLKLNWKLHYLSVLDSSVVHASHLPIYTFEDSGRVYAWLVDSFYLIQDFTLGVGDTLAIRNGFDLNQLYAQKPYSYLTIDSVDTLNIYGKNRRVQYYRPIDSWHIWTDYCLVPSASPYNFVSIEGIGWDGFMFPVAGFVDPENGGPLRCYMEPGMGLHNCGTIPCDTIYRMFTGLDKRKTLRTFPVKIINHRIWYDFLDDSQLRVFDVLGRLVLERSGLTGPGVIPIPHNISGYVIAQIQAGDNIFSQSFVIR